ncbi:uncharacterized protein LOC119454016 [Dermacentor silvarum]|uniref:uncharacterized protein LOC119454016 n=1 Tax=Dermacentor silvarum TaxID=543639 RepID=UPI002100EC8F|nr:uncharacterized protein LOC119454016 [Dermacentor silvarum]
MGGSGSRAAATADRPAPPPKQQQQARPDALALTSAHRRSSGPLLVPRYVMFIRRAWSRLRKPAASTTAAPYTSPAANRDAGAQPSTSPSTATEDNGKAAGGGPSTRATSLMGAVMSSAAEERIQWRRAGRDRRRSWGFRKLKTRSDSAVSSPEGAASLKTPTNLTADVAGALAEGSPRSPPANKPGLSPAATLDSATVPSTTAGADDYACLAEDDINWSTGYVKLCCMPDALNQDCSSFQDLRKGLDEYPATTVQSQVVVERLQSVEQRVNLRDGRSVFSETTERICYGRKTTQVVSDGNTSAEPAGELMTFDTSASATTAVLQRSCRRQAEAFQERVSWTADVYAGEHRRRRADNSYVPEAAAATGSDDLCNNARGHAGTHRDPSLRQHVPVGACGRKLLSGGSPDPASPTAAATASTLLGKRHLQRRQRQGRCGGSTSGLGIQQRLVPVRPPAQSSHELPASTPARNVRSAAAPPTVLVRRPRQSRELRRQGRLQRGSRCLAQPSPPPPPTPSSQSRTVFRFRGEFRRRRQRLRAEDVLAPTVGDGEGVLRRWGGLGHLHVQRRRRPLRDRQRPRSAGGGATNAVRQQQPSL